MKELWNGKFLNSLTAKSNKNKINSQSRKSKPSFLLKEGVEEGVEHVCIWELSISMFGQSGKAIINELKILTLTCININLNIHQLWVATSVIRKTIFAIYFLISKFSEKLLTSFTKILSVLVKLTWW